MSYRRRLRREGANTAACGALSAVLLAGGATAMATLGARSIRASISRSPKNAGHGERRPLRRVPFITAGPSLAFRFRAGRDAGPRMGRGCIAVGVAQAVLFERMVTAEESAAGQRFFPVFGSSPKLGRVP